MRKAYLLVQALIMAIMVCSATVVQADSRSDDTGTVAGEIGIKGVGPMMGGTVFFYNAEAGLLPSATRYWLVPTHAFEVGQNAQFTAVLPEGSYYMGAIERRAGEALGPPQEGDYFFISQDKKGNPKQLSVWKNSIVNLGVLIEAVPFSRSTLATKGITSIEGTIRDKNGKPAEGMLVFAFITPEMFGRPTFVSERSDKDGKYLLRVHGSGKFYLRTRQNYGGGPPAADELMGVYKNGKPVILNKGERKKGINISVAKVGSAAHWR